MDFERIIITFDNIMRRIQKGTMSIGATDRAWSDADRALYIDSVCCGFPQAEFVLQEDKYGNLTIIDGNNRIDAIIDYVGDRFAITRGEDAKSNNAGMRFSELKPIVQNYIQNMAVSAIIIKPRTTQEEIDTYLKRIHI
jgi:hypothetical protein